MYRIKFEGPVSLRTSSFLALNRIALSTYAKRAMGHRMEPSWDTNLEIGVRFWRRQFSLALTAKDIKTGRKILDKFGNPNARHLCRRLQY